MAKLRECALTQLKHDSYWELSSLRKTFQQKDVPTYLSVPVKRRGGGGGPRQLRRRRELGGRVPPSAPRCSCLRRSNIPPNRRHSRGSPSHSPSWHHARRSGHIGAPHCATFRPLKCRRKDGVTGYRRYRTPSATKATLLRGNTRDGSGIWHFVASFVKGKI